MKRIFELIVICLVTCFSFYYTEKIVDLSKRQDPIMQMIEEAKLDKEVEAVNGILSDKTMQVGSSGLEIDEDISYEKMKKLDKYNEELLEYIEIKPDITKEHNFDKLITGTITDEKKMSFVFFLKNLDKLDEIIYILNINNVSATFFVDVKIVEDNIFSFKQILNKSIRLGIYGYDNVFNEMSVRYTKGLISKNFVFSNYCLYKNDEFLESCSSLKINTIKPFFVENNLYEFMKENKSNGLIYLIEDSDSNIRQLNTTIKYLKQKGYIFETIDDLLKE